MTAESGASQCGCLRCIAERGDKVNGMPRLIAEMVVCPSCGDKRCLHAYTHEAPCAKVDLYGHNAWVERVAMRTVPASAEDSPQVDAVISLGAWEIRKAGT